MSEISIKNTLTEGLQLEYEINIPYSQINQRAEEKIAEIQKTYKMMGFILAMYH